MHPQAMEWLTRQAATITRRARILDLGSKNVNGSCRELFADSQFYHGVDRLAGDGVDEIADAGEWSKPPHWPLFDVVVCTEVLEHAPQPEKICRVAWESLAPGGVFLVTAANPDRREHSVDGGPLKRDEYYKGVRPDDLRDWLRHFATVELDQSVKTDIYARAVKE